MQHADSTRLKIVERPPYAAGALSSAQIPHSTRSPSLPGGIKPDRGSVRTSGIIRHCATPGIRGVIWPHWMMMMVSHS